MKSLKELLNLKMEKKMKLVVVAANDREVIAAVDEARELDVIDPILIGDQEEILAILEEKAIDKDQYRIIDEKDVTGAAELGVKMVSNGEADFIMKGLLDT